MQQKALTNDMSKLTGHYASCLTEITAVEGLLCFRTEGFKARNPSKTLGLDFGIVLIERRTGPWPSCKRVWYEDFPRRFITSFASVGVHRCPSNGGDLIALVHVQ